jgi:hypothetical protein
MLRLLKCSYQLAQHRKSGPKTWQKFLMFWCKDTRNGEDHVIHYGMYMILYRPFLQIQKDSGAIASRILLVPSGGQGHEGGVTTALNPGPPLTNPLRKSVPCAFQAGVNNMVNSILPFKNTGPAHFGGNASAILIPFVPPTLFVHWHWSCPKPPHSGDLGLHARTRFLRKRGTFSASK